PLRRLARAGSRLARTHDAPGEGRAGRPRAAPGEAALARAGLPAPRRHALLPAAAYRVRALRRRARPRPARARRRAPRPARAVSRPPATRRPGIWSGLTAGPTGRWTPWKFTWLANHKLVSALERVRVHARGDLLDVGCGSKPFARLFAARVRHYWGSDLAASRYLGEARPDAYATAEAQPFRAASFDTVLGLSMLTYLPEPI